jgi:hypothetical protein
LNKNIKSLFIGLRPISGLFFNNLLFKYKKARFG